MKKHDAESYFFSLVRPFEKKRNLKCLRCSCKMISYNKGNRHCALCRIAMSKFSKRAQDKPHTLGEKNGRSED